MAATKNDPVWLISGCSTGFGRELGKAVLARGWRAVVTARDPATLEDLTASAPDRALALRLDVTSPGDIKAAVAAAEARFGGIDVLVNNAGYGYAATVEEADDAMVRDMFETNFFGLFHLTQAVLPVMRRQRSGHIFNIGSVAGVVSAPSGGFYSATKHALEGFTQALAAEIAPIGLKATVVEPGAFRTDFSSRSIRTTTSTIEDYAPVTALLEQLRARQGGVASGDPARAAEVIIEAYLAEAPPLHLPLGPDALKGIELKVGARLAELKQWSAKAGATNFAE